MQRVPEPGQQARQREQAQVRRSEPGLEQARPSELAPPRERQEPGPGQWLEPERRPVLRAPEFPEA